jgi:hypothetical protein
MAVPEAKESAVISAAMLVRCFRRKVPQHANMYTPAIVHCGADWSQCLMVSPVMRPTSVNFIAPSPGPRLALTR